MSDTANLYHKINREQSWNNIWHWQQIWMALCLCWQNANSQSLCLFFPIFISLTLNISLPPFTLNWMPPLFLNFYPTHLFSLLYFQWTCLSERGIIAPFLQHLSSLSISNTHQRFTHLWPAATLPYHCQNTSLKAFLTESWCLLSSANLNVI